jgi:mono/diheme cytochrome c family protein
MKRLAGTLFLLIMAGAALAQEPGDLFLQGKQIFADHCAECHRLNGQGLPGTFPAHDGNPFVVGPPEPVIATVLNGRKGTLGRMPTWKDELDDHEIAAVVTYIRHAWTNRAAAVTPALVAAIRSR